MILPSTSTGNLCHAVPFSSHPSLVEILKVSASFWVRNARVESLMDTDCLVKSSRTERLSETTWKSSCVLYRSSKRLYPFVVSSLVSPVRQRLLMMTFPSIGLAWFTVSSNMIYG